MGEALPVLLIILVMVAVVFAVGMGVAYVIKSSMHKAVKFK
jgi:hypothetical protein